ncbi:hypothetical protein [Thermococcus sp.]|uniref:hypothetical protein n=1 Tax=Thermococcus sp. TaxID=35749 RepID=UPI002633A8A8|nr:hypothetical protein [Thermococcus sp.]
MSFVPAVKRLKLSEEVQAKWGEAVQEFNALKVQVLIDDDDLPEDAVNVIDLERLVSVLEDAPAPSRVYVDGKVYRVKLRRKVEYGQYRALMEEFGKLGRAWWDKRERVIKVLRYEVRQEGVETPEVEVIVPGQGVVGTMHGGGVE